MYALLQADPVTLMIVAAAGMVTPLHPLATGLFSGASARKGVLLASGVLAWGAA